MVTAIGDKRPIARLAFMVLITLSAGCSNPWIANGFQAPTLVSNNQTLEAELPQDELLVALKKQIFELNEERTQLILANKALKSELSSQRIYTAKLKLAYLEKHADVNKLILDQQATIQEMVRIQAKLLSRNSRAETVSTMAEATILVNNALELAPENQKQVASRAHQLLLMSNEALGEENYDGATFLANQAAVMVQPIMSQAKHLGASENDIQFEARFAVPIKMKSLAISNVRTAPSVKSNILFSLTQGQEVVADGYIDDWIHISLNENEHGWVYFRLVDLVL